MIGQTARRLSGNASLGLPDGHHPALDTGLEVPLPRVFIAAALETFNFQLVPHGAVFECVFSPRAVGRGQMVQGAVSTPVFLVMKLRLVKSQDFWN